MNVRDFSAKDYDEVCSWWVAYGWGKIPLVILPAAGFVVESDGINICAGWIYEDKNAPFGMMEWIVSNPDSSSTESYKALNMLIETISKYADESKLVLHTSCKVKGLLKLYENHGFSKADEHMTNMVRM